MTESPDPTASRPPFTGLFGEIEAAPDRTKEPMMACDRFETLFVASALPRRKAKSQDRN